MVSILSMDHFLRRARYIIFFMVIVSIFVILFFANRMLLLDNNRRKLLEVTIHKFRLKNAPLLSTNNYFLNNSVTVEKLDIPLILLWTNWFGDAWPYEEGRMVCGEQKLKCDLTRDQFYYDRSHAVVFHGADPATADRFYYPDIRFRPTDQVWVYHNMENPIISSNMGVLLDDQVDGLFNWTMTYSQDADIVIPYGGVYKGKFKTGFDPHKNYAAGKTGVIAWVSSKCYDGRTSFVHNLSQYVQVDKYGECGDRYCPRDNSCWSYIADSYKFYLSFENQVCKDYVTEKFYNNALELGLVPIVIGGADYNNIKYAPPKSFIDALKFENVEELAKFVTRIDKNDKLYNNFFRWRANYTIAQYNTLDYFCALCVKLHSVKSAMPVTQVHNDISTFWGIHDGNCDYYPVSDDSRMKLNFKYYRSQKSDKTNK